MQDQRRSKSEFPRFYYTRPLNSLALLLFTKNKPKGINRAAQRNGVDVYAARVTSRRWGTTDMLLILFLALGLLMGFGWIGEMALGYLGSWHLVVS